MTTKYFKYPFAVSGDRATLPDPTQLDGTVSYQSGFPVDYQLAYSDPSSLNIPRDQFNQAMYDMTLATKQIQENGLPEFITTAMNDGTPFPYSVNACVYQPADGNNYTSLINSNTDVPPSVNWRLITFASGIPSGVGMEYWGVSLPSGWLWQSGQTIGNASSNGTARANADTAALFTLLWALPSTTFQLYNSAGSPVTRGVSAAADYAANRAMSLPDTRERVVAGTGTMGGTSDPSRITVGGAGFSGAVVGANGGLETVTLVAGQLASHSHTGTTSTDGLHLHDALTLHYWDGGGGGGNAGLLGSNHIPNPAVSATGVTDDAGAHNHSFTTNTTGGDQAHQNTQPTIICNKIIKL